MRMYLYYDRVSKMFTLDLGEEGVEFLGPMTNALVTLKNKFFLTDSQAREAALQAVFNMGDSVDISTIKKIASTESKFYRKNVA
jgi:pyruvate carboxylase